MAERFLRDYPGLRPFILSNVEPSGNEIGGGAYGKVEEVVIPVGAAAKTIRDYLLGAKASKQFVEECRLMSKLRHPNIVQFLGVTFFPNSRLPALVMERLLTSLHELLAPDSPPPPGAASPVSFFSLALKCSVLHNVACGLAYLHEQSPRPVIHRDLSARNVLLDSDMVAKIGDLGMARIIHCIGSAATMTKAPGASVYMPPEASAPAQSDTEKSKYDSSIDVFSLGVITIFTIGEVFPCDPLEHNYFDEKSGMLLGRTELQRRREYMRCVNEQLHACGQLHEDHPLILLIQQCLQNLPAKRPGICEVLHLLEEAQACVIDDHANSNKRGLVRALQTQPGNQNLMCVVKHLVTKNETQLRELAGVQQQLSHKEEELQASEREKQTVTEQLRRKDIDLAEAQTQLRIKEEELQANERERQTVIQQKDADLAKAWHLLGLKELQLSRAKNTIMRDQQCIQEMKQRETELLQVKDKELAEVQQQLRQKVKSKEIELQKILQQNQKLKAKLCDTELLQVWFRSESPVSHIPDTTIESLFRRIGLLQKFPQKLSIRDAIQIREDTHQLPSDPTLYPYVMLQKIMSYDYKCRFGLRSSSGSASGDDSSSDPEDDEDDGSIHPMDGLLALIHCSDNFLRQQLFCRLAACQIAVPLLLPNSYTRDPTLLLWALRSIVKEFQFPDGKKYNGRIITHPTQFVSFLRLGCSAMSKSETLNDVMNMRYSNIKNNPFFHYNSPGGTSHKLLVNGLVEMSWYLPGDGLYPKPIAFTNLRGDATDPKLQKQVDFLCELSTLHVVLLSPDMLEEATTKDSATELLKRLSQAPGGLIVVETKPKRGFKSQISQCIGAHLFKSTVTFIKKERSTTVFLEKLKANLKNKLEISSKDVSLTSIARKCGIAIDEDGIDCVKGRQLMEDLYTVIEEYRRNNPDQSPKALLPLQNKDLWQKWAELDKEQFRQKKKQQELTSQEYSAEQRKKMNIIRQQQYPLAMQCNELMSTFLKTLKTEKDCVLHYYLVWLKFKLDDLSRDVLPPFYVRIYEKRKELSDIQLKHDDEAESKCQEELKELDCQLLNASFGLEHLFREVGQIYEAAMAVKTSTTSSHNMISSLPQIAAQLLCDGFPLELLDGDASHIPQKWISAVLNSLADILKEKHHGSDPHVYVLSILGVQSTGKSTLLNTVFGAKFSVSAGRCTRGAFMQLIPVHPSLYEKIGAQYFLLIDTEGLKAPELDQLEAREHDNELVTFVIGMANLTLINVVGEVSGDMNDILTIVVHAFLRMNQVHLFPSCHIIHQHVVAVRSDEKMMQGRLKTKDNLDRMTKAAAEETGVETQYTHFSDVIKFDHEKNVSFFPDLWNGEPPMGCVSPGYSEEAQHLKVAIIANSKTITKYSICNLKLHLARLWKAILQEDFVFTFQNGFEIVAFKTLEKKFSDWSWELRVEMSEWERTAQTKLYACDTQEIDDVNAQLMDELRRFINKKQMEYEKKTFDYFNESNNKIMLKWKPDMELRLENLCRKLECHAEEHCLQVYQAQRSRTEADNEKGRLSTIILGYIQKLIASLSNPSEDYDDKQLKEIFDSKWDEWTRLLTCRMMPLKRPNITAEVESCMTEFFRAQRKFILQKLADKDHGKSLREWGKHLQLPIRACHIKVDKSLTQTFFLNVSPRSSFFPVASQITCTTLEYVRAHLEHIKRCDKNFNSKLVTDLLRLLEEKSKVNVEGFKFTEEYEIELALTACGYAINVFEEIADAFQRKHDPIQYVRFEMKSQFERTFKNMYRSRKHSQRQLLMEWGRKV